MCEAADCAEGPWGRMFFQFILGKPGYLMRVCKRSFEVAIGLFHQCTFHRSVFSLFSLQYHHVRVGIR